MIEVSMPRLSDSMEEGLIVAWLVGDGTSVVEGDELVEIETDKATMTYEADGSGLVHIVAKEGDSLPVGAPIAQLLSPGEEPSTGTDAGTESPTHPASSDDIAGRSNLSPNSSSPRSDAPDKSGDQSRDAAVAASSGEPPHEVSEKRVKASPIARRLAADHDVELGALSGSGPGGRIVKADVNALLEPSADIGRRPTSESEVGEKGETTVVEINRLQQTIARRMAESKSAIPHFYLSTEIDMTSCVNSRARMKEASGPEEVVPSINDMVVKACGIALAEFPKANGRYEDGRLELYSRVNVGVAVAADGSLVVPVVPDADRIGLRKIGIATRRLAERVREGTVSPSELSGGTFTVSNLGMFGVTDFSAVINPGQAAILAVGSIEDRAGVREGNLCAIKAMGVTLSCDHRILYGAEGAAFLARIKTLLEEPAFLAL